MGLPGDSRQPANKLNLWPELSVLGVSLVRSDSFARYSRVYRVNRESVGSRSFGGCCSSAAFNFRLKQLAICRPCGLQTISSNLPKSGHRSGRGNG